MAVMGCPRLTSFSKAWPSCLSEVSLAENWGSAPGLEVGAWSLSLLACRLFGCSIRFSFTMSFYQCSKTSAQRKNMIMNSSTLTLLLKVAGLLHLGLICD